MQTGWTTVKGRTFYLKDDGVMAASEYIDGWWLDSNGVWTYPHRASWKKDGNRWWYGDTNGWYARNASYKIDGKVYKFDKDGWLV